MKRIKTSHVNVKPKGLNLVAVLVLLCVYLIGTVEVSSLHQLFHDPVDKEVLHSEINEQNSCHQILYHNAQEKSCEHPTHIAAAKKCSWCQLSIQSFHLFDTKSIVELDFSVEARLALTDSFQAGKPSLLLAPRAPPIA